MLFRSLLHKAHEAKNSGQHHFTIWGSGAPRREFLHVDDCADALIHLLKRYSGHGHVNVGSGSDITIAELAEIVATIVGFKGRIEKDTSKPDGTPRKLLDVGKLAALGWQARIPLETGLAQTYSFFLKK